MRTPANFTRFYNEWKANVALSNLPPRSYIEQQLKDAELSIAFIRHACVFLKEKSISAMGGIFLNRLDAYEDHHKKTVDSLTGTLEAIDKAKAEGGKDAAADAYSQLKKNKLIKDIKVDGDKLLVTTNDLSYEHDLNIGQYQFDFRTNSGFPLARTVSFPGIPARWGAEHPHINLGGGICWGYWKDEYVKYMQKGDLFGCVVS